MDIYYLLPIVTLLFHFLSYFLNKRFDKVLLILLGIAFFLIVGLREVGFDYEMYENLHRKFQSRHWYEESIYYSTELGYSFINHLVPNFHLLVALISAVIITVFFKFIYNNTRYPFIAIFVFYGIFFYTSLMGQYRQAFALAMMLLAITNIHNKKKFLLYIFSGFAFHYTAILTVVFLFIPKKLYKLKVYIYLLICSIIIAIFFPIFFSQIASVTSYMETKSSYYEQADYEKITGVNSVILIRLGWFALGYYYRKQLAVISNMHFYLNAYFMSLLIYISFSFMTALASRGSLYFAFFEVILAANILYVLRRKLILHVILIAALVTVSFLRQQNSFKEENFKECFLPYKNVLSKYL